MLQETNVVEQWSEAAFYWVGVAAALASTFTYWRNSKRARTKWLYELHQRFYEREDLKRTWTRMDTRGPVAGGRLKDIPELDDLLNFFEFIALLEHRGELMRNEIHDIFSYPLRRLGSDSAVRTYLKEYDYEHLEALLRDFGYTAADAGRS